MPTLALSVSYRPVRIGLLIREDHVSDLVEAVRLNTALWGGMYNPIVPVGEETVLADRLVRCFRVDVLQPVVEDEALTTFAARYPWLQWPLPYDRSGLVAEDEGGERFVTADVLPFIQHSVSRRSDGAGRNCVLVKWQSDDPLATLFGVMFGDYPQSGPGSDYASLFQMMSQNDPVMIESAPVSPGLIGRWKPILFTTEHLKLSWPGRSDFPGIYVGDPTEVRDLIAFWNRRAAGTWLTFCPLGDDNRLVQYVSEHVSRVGAWLHGSPGLPRRIAVWYRKGGSADGLSRPNMGGCLPASTDIVLRASGDDDWAADDIQPCVYQSERHTVLAHLDQATTGGPTVIFSLPPRPVPQLRSTPLAPTHCMAVVRPLSESEYSGHTLALPPIAELNKWYSDACGMHRYAMRGQPDGVAVLEEVSEELSRLRPARHRDLIVQVLKHAGISASPSRPGMIAERLIAQMGGLEACRVFQLPGVRKLIANAAARKGIARSAATQIIYDEGADRSSSFEQHTKAGIGLRGVGPSMGFRGVSTHAVLDELLEVGMMRPGLRPQCPNCDLPFWISVDELREHCKCEFCGHAFRIGPHLRSGSEWQFRLTGLFGREDHQEGAVPVALTLVQLGRCEPTGSPFIHSTALDLQFGSRRCEADMVVLQTSRDGRVRMLLGECKSAGPVDEKDVSNLAETREMVSNAGIDCTLLFAKTAPQFEQAEVEQFKALQAAGVPLVLFTARELEPWQPYWSLEGKPEDVPRPNPFSFPDLTTNSVWRYLEQLPSDGA